MKKQSIPNNLTIRTSLLKTMLLLCITGSLLPLKASILVYAESFESDGAGERYFLTGGFSDDASDYFVRTDGSFPSGLPDYSNFEGSYFWAAEDTESSDNPNEDISSLEIPGIEVSEYPEIHISLLLGAGSQSAFDNADDYVSVQYRFDQGPWEEALHFKNDLGGSNRSLRQDTNLDGTGDGTVITSTLQDFTSNALATSGSQVDLKIETLLSAGDEAIAFDDVQVTAVPEPAYLGLFMGLSAFIFRRINQNMGHPVRKAQSRA